MNAFGKASLITLGVLLFWTTFVLGVESVSQGSANGFFGVFAFLAILVALTAEKFRAYLARVTRAERYPVRVFVVLGVFLLIFLPQAISIANDPLVFVNDHVTRSLVDMGVAAALSVLALAVNGLVYLVTER